MRVRALSATGDYTFGRGQGNFLVSTPAAVAQLVQTGLMLAQGEWFLDKYAGTPWSSQILGYGTAPTYDMAIRAQILATPGVTAINSYSSNLNAATRQLTVVVGIQTQFGATTVSVTI
jgi:hypothetical protein